MLGLALLSHLEKKNIVAFPIFVHMVVGYIKILSKPPMTRKGHFFIYLHPILRTNNTHGIQHWLVKKSNIQFCNQTFNKLYHHLIIINNTTCIYMNKKMILNYAIHHTTLNYVKMSLQNTNNIEQIVNYYLWKFLMQNKATFQIHGSLIFTSYHLCKTNKKTKAICKYKKLIVSIRQKWMPK